MAVDFSNIEEVKDRIKEIQIELAAHSISKNRKVFKADTIAVEVVERRSVLVPELLKLENRLRQLNTLNRTKRVESGDTIWKDTMYEILGEVFGKDEYRKLHAECINRSKGGLPNKITLNYGYNQNDKDEIKRLTKLSTELKETLLVARKQVDRYIRQNEPEVNKADYHTKTRELITCMPSEKDIFKIKITPTTIYQ